MTCSMCVGIFYVVYIMRRGTVKELTASTAKETAPGTEVKARCSSHAVSHTFPMLEELKRIKSGFLA